MLIVGAESPTAAGIAARLAETRPDVTILTAGLGQAADWSATVESHSALATGYRVTPPDGKSWAAQLSIPGDFNVANAIVALAALDAAGFDPRAAAEALAGFRGVARRFQTHGEAAGVLVLDDYAHHPTEIAATIRALRERYATAACCCSSSRTPTAARAIYSRASRPALRASTKYFSARPTPRARIPTAA